MGLTGGYGVGCSMGDDWDLQRWFWQWGRAVEMVGIDSEGFGRGMMNGRKDRGNHADDRGIIWL